MGKRKQTTSAESVWWTEQTRLPIDELLGYISDEEERETVKTKLRNNKKLRVASISNVIPFGKNYKGQTVMEAMETKAGKNYLEYMMTLTVKDKETDEDTGEFWLEKWYPDVFDEIIKRK